MRVTADERRKITQTLTGVLGDGKILSRSDILDAAMEAYGVSHGSDDELATAPEYNTLRSYMGVILNELIRSGDVVRSGEGYCLCGEEPVAVERQDCKAQMLKLLGERAYTKSELYAALGAHFGTDKTRSLADDNALKGIAGQILSQLVADNVAAYEGGRYQLMKIEDPSSYRHTYTDLAAFKRAYINRLHEKGGHFFETFCANLIEKYFQVTGRRVLFCDVTGGSDDGGIDIEMRTQDDLGFVERVMLQVKCRANIRTSERDVREFFGAMNANGGTRGIYLTLGYFHASAQKLLDSIPNCVGIDGDKLFHIALITDYGITRTHGGYGFDEMIFA